MPGLADIFTSFGGRQDGPDGVAIIHSYGGHQAYRGTPTPTPTPTPARTLTTSGQPVTVSGVAVTAGA